MLSLFLVLTLVLMISLIKFTNFIVDGVSFVSNSLISIDVSSFLLMFSNRNDEDASSGVKYFKSDESITFLDNCTRKIRPVDV